MPIKLVTTTTTSTTTITTTTTTNTTTTTTTIIIIIDIIIIIITITILTLNVHSTTHVQLRCQGSSGSVQLFRSCYSSSALHSQLCIYFNIVENILDKLLLL